MSDVLIGPSGETSQEPESLAMAQVQRSATPNHRERRLIQHRTLGLRSIARAMVGIVRRFAKMAIVDLSMRKLANLLGANRGGHEALGELLTQHAKFVDILSRHTSL